MAHGISPYGLGAHGLAAPVVASHGISPYGLSPYASIARPAILPGLARPAVAVARPVGVVGAGLLGVAYSAAPTVAHMSYSNGLGLSYAW